MADQDRNAEILFEGLRSILFDGAPQAVDTDTLDPAFRDLGEGLNFLRDSVLEMKNYAAALSRGNLSVEPPSRENFLCQGLKSIHANLNHLSWQAKQVAKGDYSQNVSYMGEFSDAFNRMTKQLSDREKKLKEDAQAEKSHAETVESYNELLMELLHDSEEKVLVTAVAQPKILYPADGGMCSRELAEKCIYFHREAREGHRWEWEVRCSDGCDYRVITGAIQWQGERAYAHILRDVTRQREMERRLTEAACRDALTGIGNRFYFEEELRRLLNTPGPFCLCYCDLDHLKYINDNLGHQEGDWYIRRFTGIVESAIRRGDVFTRIGGDEFCLLLPGCTREAARRRVEKMQFIFQADTTRGYDKNFSCGIVEVPGDHRDTTAEEIIQQADSIMYAQKARHKEEYYDRLEWRCSDR